VALRVAAFILGNIGIARLGRNFEPLILQDEIDRGDVIFGLDRLVGDMVNGDDELGPWWTLLVRER
jgi:hypothetical protein